MIVVCRPCMDGQHEYCYHVGKWGECECEQKGHDLEEAKRNQRGNPIPIGEGGMG